MKEEPLVSIALCTYNGAGFLRQQLDTLVSQSYQNLEIVAVDDCSSDDTFLILGEYAQKHPNFRIYQNEQNLGFTGNFERTVKLCKGGLIALCDQDDLWDSQKIELQVNAIGDNVLIYHDSEFIHEDGTPMEKKMSDVLNLYRGDRPEVFLFFNCVSGHSILMKRELIDAALPLEKGYFHDWWLAYVATNIGKIDFLPQTLVKYRQHDQSETNILKLAREKNNYKFTGEENYKRRLKWLKHCAEFDRNKNPELVKQVYEAYKNRQGSFIAFELSRLLFKHWKIIFSISKKAGLSKLNFVRKEMRGISISE